VDTIRGLANKEMRMVSIFPGEYHTAFFGFFCGVGVGIHIFSDLIHFCLL
jgi:hypothetical protein